MPAYRKISDNIQKVILKNPRSATDSITWINISNAQKDEIEYLRKKYKF